MKLTAEQQRMFDGLTRLQQKTCVNVLEGMSQRQAYVAAGGSAKTPTSQDTSATSIMSNSQVKAFMNSVLHARANHAIMTREEAMVRLSNIARAGINHVADITPNGLELKPDIPDQVMECVEDLGFYGDAVKVKMKSTTEAIKQLRMMEAWDKQAQPDEPDPLEVESDTVEVARRLLFTLNKAKKAIA